MRLPVIQTKLRVPAVKDEFLRRAKLSKKMKKIPEYPLTILHSGAGFGKSTALALFMKDEPISGCWYSISSMDDDILPFLSHVIYSIRKITPEFGKELLTYIETTERYIRNEELSLLCSLFINEILDTDSEIILILDDFHQIEQSYTINSWMEKLLPHIPDNLHIVISSRSRPVWKHLTKMKVTGQLLEITREELVLTTEEMELLLSDLYGIQLEEKQLQTIYQITEGWIIALCMIAEQLPVDRDLSRLTEHSSQSLHDFFQYLVMEVFSKQPILIQQFLEQSSIFEEIEADICDEVFGFQTAGAMLEQLKDRNLFIQKVGSNHYRYHALFKDFLEDHFQTNHPENYRLLHERCARFFERRELWEKALYHYRKINHYKAIASILHEQGYKMLESGKLEGLFDLLTSIPKDVMSADSQLMYVKGEVYRYRSHYQDAENCYQMAYIIAKNSADHVGMSKALEGKAMIYLDTIQPQQAEMLLYEAIDLREKSAALIKENGRLYELLSENLLNLGKAKEAEKWLLKAMNSTNVIVDGGLRARLYLRTGRFEEAKKFLYAKKEEMAGASLSSLPQAHREIDLLLSLIEAFTGEGNQAKKLAQAGIQQGIGLKAPFVEACGWIRMGHAVQILNQYDSSLAENCYHTALELMDTMNVERGKAEPLMGLCHLYGARGEYERAIAAGKKALQETERVHDHWLSSLIIQCMGITCMYNDRVDQALPYFEQTDSLFRQCEDSFGQMVSKFWLSYYFFIKKDQDTFRKYIDAFLTLVQIHNYEFFFQVRSFFGPRDLQVFVPLLIEALKISQQNAYAAKILQDMGITSIESHPGYTIRVKTLGHFKIWLGDKEVSEKEWQREKAKELFQLLITAGELITKEEIIGILWPNQDKKTADRDFKVALNSLQNVLEPSRKARAAPFFIIREGSFYGFNPLAAIETDTGMFQELVEKGLMETEPDQVTYFLEKGLRFYQGEYLPDRRYEDWCIGKRERMLVFFLRGAEKMAQLKVRREHFDEAINWCEKILERDRTWEEAYRLLMYCYYRKNNRPHALKWYKKCTEVLEKELGVTPLEPTKHMYEMICEADAYIHPLKQP